MKPNFFGCLCSPLSLMEKQPFYSYFFFPILLERQAGQLTLVIGNQLHSGCCRGPLPAHNKHSKHYSVHPWVFQSSLCETWCDHEGRAWPQPKAAVLEEHGQVWGQIQTSPLNLTSIAAVVACIPTWFTLCSPAYAALARPAGRKGGPWPAVAARQEPQWAAGRPLPLLQFLCCGKHSPFGDTTNVEHKTCPSGQIRNAGQVRERFLPPHAGVLLLLPIC